MDSEEVPAVFSHTTSFEFVREVSGDEVQERLEEWIEKIRQWVIENKYFIGHIKIFAESEKDLSLWISTTGKKINVKALKSKKDINIKGININMTAIVFRIDEQVLESVILET
jgi:hypothetical protein